MGTGRDSSTIVRSRWGVLGAMALALALLGAACSSGGDSSSSDTSAGGSSGPARASVTVAVGALDPVFTQAYVTQEAGFFDDENLDVNLNVAGSNVVNLLVSGQADLALLGTSSAFVPVREGKQTSIIYGNLGGGTSGFMVGTGDITEPSGCSRVGTLNVGSAVYAWATLYESAYDADYEIVPFQDYPTIIAATQSGNVDCAVAAYGSLAQGINDGTFKLIVDPRNEASLPSSVPTDIIEGALWGMSDNLNSRSDVMVRFLRAYNKGLELINSSSETELAELMTQNSEWATFGGQKLAELIEFQKYAFAPNDGYISPDGWTANIEFFKNGGLEFIDPANPTWGYDERVDMSFYDQAIG